MPIQYVLHRNPFNNGKGIYHARIRSCGSIDMDRLIAYGEDNNMWPCRPSLVRAVLTQYGQLIQMLLLQGYRVNTEVGEYWLVIKGDFGDTSERINPKKHKLRIVVRIPRRMTQEIRKQARYQRMHGEERLPHPLKLHDGASRTFNRVITRGGGVVLTGTYLKFEADDEKQGVFLKHGTTEYRITEYLHTKPRRLILVVPQDLPNGEYQLYVRAKLRHTSEIREGHYAYTLRVVDRGEKIEIPGKRKTR